MFLKYHHLAYALALFCISCASAKNKSANNEVLPATSILPVGRYAITDDKNLELISTAVHFGFSFEGKECRLYVSVPNGQSHNYLQYELDGVYQSKLKVLGNLAEPIVITAPSEGKHTVWIYKTTEATTGPIMVQKVEAKNIKSIAPKKAPFIEFIGNSITCGAAADPSEVPCGTGVYHDQHNAYYAYGPRVSRALGANYMVSSVSGIGMYRNWNSDGPAMPEVYENTTLGQRVAQPWNFSKYAPDVVSIALGTNDFSNGDGVKKRLPFDSATFVNRYIQFVQTVKSKYPSAQIALLSSPMVRGSNRELLQNCLMAVKRSIDAKYVSGKRVATYFFEPMQARGCTGHPNVEDHAILANELIPFFKKLL